MTKPRPLPPICCGLCCNLLSCSLAVKFLGDYMLVCGPFCLRTFPLAQWLPWVSCSITVFAQDSSGRRASMTLTVCTFRSVCVHIGPSQYIEHPPPMINCIWVGKCEVCCHLNQLAHISSLWILQVDEITLNKSFANKDIAAVGMWPWPHNHNWTNV